MTRPSCCWRALGLLLLLAALGWLPARRAHAAPVVCSAPYQSTITFGTIDVSVGSGASVAASIPYTCTNNNPTPASFTLCTRLGTPSYPGTPDQPILTDYNHNLDFNLYTDAPHEQVWGGTNYISTTISLPGGIGNSISGNFAFYGFIPGNQPSAPAGAYQATFNNTLLGFVSGGQCLPGDNVNYSGLDFAIGVSTVVGNACTVSVDSTLNLGKVPSTATDITGQGSVVRVTCPSDTPYNVGLLPSNSNPEGAGVLSGPGGQIPYQLRSGPGLDGPVWGNTATPASIGNGVHGMGNGTPQPLTVYVTVPSAAYALGTYTDVVTVNVNY
jgi:spore coat protein U-like protein